MSTAISVVLSEWAGALRYEDIPDDVVPATRWRMLDVIGLALAGYQTPFGVSVRDAVKDMHGGGASRVWGDGAAVSAVGAALSNGAAAQALEFDDTHNTSIVHMSAPAVAAALALAAPGVSVREVIRAIAIGNEISCRVGSAAPGQFHKRGFHPTGLFAVFGATWLAGSLRRLDGAAMTNAAGIAGSFASGILQCWADGTQSKFIHPGWAAQGGVTAAALAAHGVTGPRDVFEGRFGLFASHLQADQTSADLGGIVANLGAHWESRNASFKPYPAAHVIHPYLDAALRLKRENGFAIDDIERVECPVAPYQIGIVCEPLSEKRRPNTDSHGRVSLSYSLAEALVKGKLGRDAYAAESLRDPVILALADRVEHVADASFPGPERFKAIVRVTLKDGRTLETIEEDNRGSARNPMTLADLIAKFEANCVGLLSASEMTRLSDAVLNIDLDEDAARIVALTEAGRG